MIVAFSISPTPVTNRRRLRGGRRRRRVVRESGLPNETNAMFTNIEGEWDEVMAVVKRAVDVVAAVSPRVGLVLKADIRPGYDGQLTAKVERVERALDADVELSRAPPDVRRSRPVTPDEAGEPRGGDRRRAALVLRCVAVP